MNTKRVNIPLPEDLKNELERVSEEIGISVSQLCVLGMWSLVANYNEKGTFIFADLLNPEHRGVKKS